MPGPAHHVHFARALDDSQIHIGRFGKAAVAGLAVVGAGAAEGAIGILFYLLPATWTVRLLNPLGRLGYPVGLGALRYINDDPERPMRAIATSVDPNILGALLIMVAAALTLWSMVTYLLAAWRSLEGLEIHPGEGPPEALDRSD